MVIRGKIGRLGFWLSSIPWAVLAIDFLLQTVPLPAWAYNEVTGKVFYYCLFWPAVYLIAPGAFVVSAIGARTEAVKTYAIAGEAISAVFLLFLAGSCLA